MPTPELEARALQALALEFDTTNYSFFRRALRPPAFALSDGSTTIGTWHRASRTITLGRGLVFGHTWDEVVEVLKHEMAHQYAHEVLGAVDERAHGAAFAFACNKLAIDASAGGPIKVSDPHDPRHKAVERIHKLLALAASPNQNEAEAAMRAARRKMLEHHIESVRSDVRYGTRRVGPVKARFHAWEKFLAGLLGAHFFVRPIWIPTFVAAEGRQGDVLEISGASEDLEVAEYVHSFMSATGERLWREHKRAHGIGADRDRLRFLSGVMLGFSDKLAAEQRLEKEAGLVWVGDAGLDDFVDRRHPRLHRTGVRVSNAGGFDEGRAAGKSVVLHKGMTAKGGGGGGLLGG